MKFVYSFLLTFTALATNTASAEFYISKDWHWSNNQEEFYYAATMNSSNHLLGQYCFFDSENCIYLIGIEVNCEIGHEYPALINSNTGSSHIKLTCSHKYEDQHFFIISPFDDIDNIVRQASKVGIVVPMEGDSFKVSRFSLAGSAYAIDLMRKSVESNISKNKKPDARPDEEFL